MSSQLSSHDTIARLTGMAVEVVNTSPYGGRSGRNWLVVDRLAPEGPAARAGFRSGDYLNMVGWQHHDTLAGFADSLLAAEAQKAAVLSRQESGLADHAAALVVFSDEVPREMIEIPRSDPSQSNGPVLAENSWNVVSAVGEDWCAAHVDIVSWYDIGASQTVPGVGGVVSDAYDRVRRECPEARTISILRKSSQLNAPINILHGTIGNQMQLIGIDGLPPGETVSDTRAIALSQAPVCDRLATHPGDPMRRYGLEGVEAIERSSLNEAIDACSTAADADPTDIVTQFHLGRVLHAGGYYEEALVALEASADSGHGGALDLLGQIHLMGDGVQADVEAARDYFASARSAGFSSNVETDPSVIDLTSLGTLSQLILEVYHLSERMYSAILDVPNVYSAYNDPEYTAFLIRLLADITTACSSETSLELLRTARSFDTDDSRDVEHALFLYSEHLPSLLPNILARTTVNDWAIEEAQFAAKSLVERYGCRSPQLRQYAINAAGMAQK